MFLHVRLGHLVTGQFQGPCSDIQVEPVSGATAGSCDHRFSRLGDPSSGGGAKAPRSPLLPAEEAWCQQPQTGTVHLAGAQSPVTPWDGPVGLSCAVTRTAVVVLLTRESLSLPGISVQPPAGCSSGEAKPQVGGSMQVHDTCWIQARGIPSPRALFQHRAPLSSCGEMWEMGKRGSSSCLHQNPPYLSYSKVLPPRAAQRALLPQILGWEHLRAGTLCTLVPLAQPLLGCPIALTIIPVKNTFCNNSC